MLSIRSEGNPLESVVENEEVGEHGLYFPFITER